MCHSIQHDPILHNAQFLKRYIKLKSLPLTLLLRLDNNVSFQHDLGMIQVRPFSIVTYFLYFFDFISNFKCKSIYLNFHSLKI
jgi:hypothetical protein